MTSCDQVTQAELHRQFHSLGAGVIEDVRVQKDKGFGFIRYRTHEEAAYAIQGANGRVICGKSVKVREFGAWSFTVSTLTSGSVHCILIFQENPTTLRFILHMVHFVALSLQR